MSVNKLWQMTVKRNAWRVMAVKLAEVVLGLMDVLTSPDSQSRRDTMDAADAILAKYEEMQKRGSGEEEIAR